MRLRLALLACVICLGCHTSKAVVLQPGAKDPVGTPSAAANYLTQAALHIAAGHDDAACDALEHFVAENPDHPHVRFYFAELLHKLGRAQEARDQFERIIADFQEEPESDYPQLIHCHGRLMELAETTDDDYLYHLHRGIGLYWVAQGSVRLGAESGDLPPEGLFCKAAGELSTALALRPGEARPAWYLYSVWHNLAQSHLAQRSLEQAREAAPFTYLTPSEQRRLQMAGASLSHPFRN